MNEKGTQFNYAWILSLLKRYWIMMLGIIIICSGAGVYKAYKSSKETQYISSVQVLINRKGNDKIELDNPLRAVGTYRDLVNNNGVIQDAQKLLKHDKLGGITAKEIRNAIKVDSQTETQVFTISAQTNSPKKSKLIAKSVSQAFQKRFRNVVSGYKIDVLDDAPHAVGVSNKENIFKWIIVGTVFGVFISAILAFLLDLNDKKVRGEYAKINMNLKNLGNFKIPKLADEIKGLLDLTSNNYRVIKSNIDLLNNGKVILITSPNNGVGKTSLTANLANAWIQHDKKVLIIDANFKNPRFSKMVRGLKRVSLNDINIVNTEINSLSLLPVEELPGYPENSLDAIQLKKLLVKVADSYDYIIVDAPALLEEANVREWGPVVDSTVVVIKENDTSKDDLKKTIEALRLGESNIIGFAMNDDK